MQEIYNKIDTNDEGEIDIKTVVEHIKAVEAGSGKNTWVGCEDLGNFQRFSSCEGQSETGGITSGRERS